MNPLISVIIPVYNTEPYLEKCLNSIISNSYQWLDIICINNESTDNSLEILNQFQKKDNRIRVIDLGRKGVSAARNEGLKNVRGEYICFIDSDDFIPLNYFQVLLDTIINNQADLVVGRIFNIFDHTEAIGLIQDYSAERIDRKYLLNHHILRTRVYGRIYSRTFIGTSLFPEDLGYGEDAIFNLFLISAKSDIVCFYLNCQVYYYYHRNNSIVTSSTTQDKLSKCRWSLKHLEEISDIDCKRLLIEDSCKSVLNNRYSCRFQDDREERMKECRNLSRELQRIMKHKTLQFSWSYRVKYGLMLKFPFLYRLYRIISDPTMIAYERKEKQKMKKQMETVRNGNSVGN